MKAPTSMGPISQPGFLRNPLLGLNNRSLRTKLLLSFMIVSILSVGGVAIFSNLATQTVLTHQVSATLHNMGQVRALIIADWLDLHIGELERLSLNETIIAQLEKTNEGYTGSPAAIRAQIEQTEQEWHHSEDLSQSAKAHLNTIINGEIIEFRFEKDTNIFITDKYGALVAMHSSSPPHYDYTHESWWATAYADGKGATFVGEPQIDTAHNITLLPTAVPFYNEDSHELLGIVYAEQSLQSLTEELIAARFGDTGDCDVLLPHHQLLRSEGNMVSINETDLATLSQHSSDLAARYMYDEEDRLVSQVPVIARGDQDPLISSLGWVLVVDQDPQEAFAPLTAAVRSTAITGIIALVAAMLLAFLVAQAISSPIKRLTTTVQQIAGGDLKRRLALQQRDEIGQLASGVNVMAESLETRISTEQQAQAEAIRLQKAETENRQRLELAVAEYLQFVQKIADGNLSQRLHIQYEGALGQLGQGLNGMAESLQMITNQVQQASNAITNTAAEILSATSQQAASAAEQSAAIAQTTTSVEEVKAIAMQTADRAGRVAQDSQSALSIAREGTGAVEDTVNGMVQIRVRVESIAQAILALAEQTQAIGTIITTVSELADQSNLLALNAAIEAARAGEQGKSFAVVAQHVRDLAERSKSATAQIKEILSEIQRTTNAAVLVTEEGTKGVEVGGKLASSAGQVIHKIAGEVESGAQANTQIAAAAQQQTAGMEQIGQAMISIQQATTQTLASTRQAERAAQDLHTLAQSLQQTIALYRL